MNKDNTTGATNDIRNYESAEMTNKYVTHDVINDATTDLAYDILVLPHLQKCSPDINTCILQALRYHEFGIRNTVIFKIQNSKEDMQKDLEIHSLVHKIHKKE